MDVDHDDTARIKCAVWNEGTYPLCGLTVKQNKNAKELSVHAQRGSQLAGARKIARHGMWHHLGCPKRTGDPPSARLEGTREATI